jgi:hypothetical protein
MKKCIILITLQVGLMLIATTTIILGILEGDVENWDQHGFLVKVRSSFRNFL